MRKYWAIFQVQLLNNVAYIGNFLAGSGMIVLFMFIFAQLWRAAYSATGGGSIAGLRYEDVLWYLMLAEVIELSKPRLAQGIAQSVRDGSVAYQLTKPYNYILYQCGVGLGDSALKVLVNAVVGGGMVWLMVGPPPDPRWWPLVLLLVFGGWLIYFCFTVLIGLAAFITEEVRAFEWIYQKLIFILGGFLIPLDLYPAWLQPIAKATPFAQAIYGPARFFVTPSWDRFGQALLGQSLWLVALVALLAFAYRQSTQRLAINGG
ncbi:MAG TPA: ABC-2 family transporter protein [Caldilineaceae bacterium]|nr:ABC-2 family transporter protein [Caldilineaceae bacterium]